MFGRKDDSAETPAQEQNITQSPAARTDGSPVAARVTAPVATPALTPRRETTHTPRRLSERNDGSNVRCLKVGEGLSLSGEISACDNLVVEGKVDAKLTDGKMLEITESGQFRGTVEIENADIAGRYDGQLTVHGRLTIRSTGRVSGMICYGELEVNAGGQIIGELQVYGEGKNATQNGGKGFKNAAKFASLVEDGDTSAAPANQANRRVVVNA